MARTTVAIDIDTSSIRLLEVRDNRVERWASASVEPGAVHDGSVADPLALGAQVKRLLRSTGVRSHKVVAGMSGLYFTSQVLTLPLQPAREAHRAMPELAKEAIPLDGTKLEWQLMPADETGQEALVVGAPTSLVDKQLAVLRSAGIDTQAMEVRTLALTRAVDRKQAIIVNVEPTSMDVVVVANGLPQIMRTLYQPRELSPEERAEQIVRAVEQTVDYFNAHRPAMGMSVDTPLFLVGSLADHPVLVLTVRSRIGHPLEPFDPPLEFPQHLPVAQYAAAIGLALRQVPRAKDDAASEQAQERAQPLHINLVPRSVPWWFPTPLRVLFLGGVVAGLVLTMTLLGAANNASAQTTALRNQLAAIQSQVNLLQVGLRERGEKEAAIKDFQNLTDSGGGLSDLFLQVQGLIPEGVGIGNFRLEEASLSITGNADSPEAAFALVKNLREHGETDENGRFHPYFKPFSYSQTQTGSQSLSFNLVLDQP